MGSGLSEAARVSGTRQSDVRVVAGVCGICPGGCGVEVELIDGKINRVLPLKDHPMGIVFLAYRCLRDDR